MNECYFVKKLAEYFMTLDHDWDWGNEINGEVKDIVDLCQQYLKERDDGTTDKQGPIHLR